MRETPWNFYSEVRAKPKSDFVLSFSCLFLGLVADLGVFFGYKVGSSLGACSSSRLLLYVPGSLGFAFFFTSGRTASERGQEATQRQEEKAPGARNMFKFVGLEE